MPIILDMDLQAGLKKAKFCQALPSLSRKTACMVGLQDSVRFLDPIPMAVRIERGAEPLPGYKLIERLGVGGFGEVWKAEVPGGLLKAIKFVYGTIDTVDASAERATQELKALSRVKSVRHPFILSLERFDIVDGQLIIVMELADRNLMDRYRECRAQQLPGIPRAELLRYLREAAEALDLMNQDYDLQHLDVKPQNLFLVHQHVKVADFGLVKDLEGRSASVTGGLTPVYAAPETFDGWVSRFCDQYSLAIVYQELLTGERPFTGQSTRQLILQHLREAPHLQALPEHDRPIIARALQKDPTKRFPSCQALVEALQDAGRTTVLVETEGKAKTETPSAGDPTPVPTPLTSELMDQVTLAPDSGGLMRRSRSTVLPPGTVRQEITGPGALTPVLVVALGGQARLILDAYLDLIALDHPDREPTAFVRTLAIDVDDARGGPRSAYDDCFHAALGRAGRYLRTREGMPPVEEWLDTRLLHRIPRNQTTGGLRALGRLALVDNYRAIVSRLRKHLQELCEERLRIRLQAHPLGMRSNVPRVYLVASVHGGTGSGMFLDMAYLARAVLLELGFARQETVGVLLVPDSSSVPAAQQRINTCAFFIELEQFLTEQREFVARYEAHTEPYRDASPPVTRTILWSVPVHADDTSRCAAEVAGWLYHETFSPLGHSSSTGCKNASAPDQPDATASVADTLRLPSYTVGWTCFLFPQQLFLDRLALTLTGHLLDLWATKRRHKEPAVEPRIQGLLAQLGLTPDELHERWNEQIATLLGASPSAMLSEWLEQGLVPSSGVYHPEALRAVLQRADELLGPPDETATARPIPFHEAATRVAEHAAHEACQALTQALLGELERPGERVAQWEDAIRQVVAILESWLQQLETQLEADTTQVRQLMAAVDKMCRECERVLAGGKLSNAERQSLMTQLPKVLQAFLQLRLERPVLARRIGLYLSLRGRMTDLMRDAGFFRHHLMHLRDRCRQDEAKQCLWPAETIRLLFPGGGHSLSEAVRRTLDQLPADFLLTLDQRIQAALIGLGRPLATWIHQPGPAFEQLRKVIESETRQMLSETLRFPDVATLLLHDEAQAAADLECAFAEAQPVLELSEGDAQAERTLCLCPDGDAGQRLARLAQTLLPHCQIVSSPDPTRIVLWRIRGAVPFRQLACLGPESWQAYEAACSLDGFTPHTRTDLFSRPVTRCSSHR